MTKSIMSLALCVMSVCICSADDSAGDDGIHAIHKGLIYAEASGQKLRLNLVVPKKKSPALVVWIHGGGWRGGSRDKVRLSGLEKQGFAVASISYRFTKTAIFPAQIHDCKAAIRWLRHNAEKYGYDAQWIAVAGSSAGGHLALLMGTSGDVVPLEGTVGEHLDESSRVQAIIDYFGPSDFVLRGRTQPERAYTDKSGSFALLGGVEGKIKPEMEKFASPATYVSHDDPPLLIFHGSKDTTVLLDQSEHMHRIYRGAGLSSRLVVQDGAGHGAKALFSGQHLETARTFLLTGLKNARAQESREGSPHSSDTK